MIMPVHALHKYYVRSRCYWGQSTLNIEFIFTQQRVWTLWKRLRTKYEYPIKSMDQHESDWEQNKNIYNELGLKWKRLRTN